MAQPVLLAIAVMGVLLLWRHRENINRLLAGKESKLGAKKK
jgi:glycerol-3-phosphate acyltransferase PlsY